jgi:hypothetical protein
MSGYDYEDKSRFEDPKHWSHMNRQEKKPASCQFDTGFIIGRFAVRCRLGDLRPGTMFETEAGDYGVLTDGWAASGQAAVVWLANGHLGSMPVSATVEEVTTKEAPPVLEPTAENIEREAKAARGRFYGSSADTTSASAAWKAVVQPLLGSRTFEPVAAEIAACPVLAKVTGKPEREAVLWLARRLRDSTALVLQLAEEPESQRSRVGPWVDVDGGARRYDDRGQWVAEIFEITGGRWSGRVLRAFAPTIVLSEWDARWQVAEAADAVLREWADVDGDAT